ncbi:hypothetical protein GN958_ATG11133 [Phytophthora infestans]|uniref:MULE transposase domain-containing protein n=1 Tax=Phytophthora infestans TaxID=4787 RepID=A0A8S9UMQ4_PHYIN|nr:hypothetical protein GN958_ATG11133 [Phytophthora infestans]
MYDDANRVSHDGNSLIVLYDTKYQAGNWLRTSATAPFFLLSTLDNLLEFIDPRYTTLFHIDSTHSIVKQCYPVSVWCVRLLWQVVSSDTFMLLFAPKFIMTDAGSAQLNACSAQVPGSKILMCSFHAYQNVRDHFMKAKLQIVTGVKQSSLCTVIRGVFKSQIKRVGIVKGGIFVLPATPAQMIKRLDKSRLVFHLHEANIKWYSVSIGSLKNIVQIVDSMSRNLYQKAPFCRGKCHSSLFMFYACNSKICLTTAGWLMHGPGHFCRVVVCPIRSQSFSPISGSVEIELCKGRNKFKLAIACFSVSSNKLQEVKNNLVLSHQHQKKACMGHR